MSDTLDEKLAKIEVRDEQLRQYFLEAMKADPTLYIADFVIYGALKRTLALSDGFRRHIRERNFTCAAALLRLQLDTALRLYAAKLHANPFAYADAIFNGKPVNKLKDRHGERMTDSYLAKRMNREFPWVKKMYDELCDFIHFSNRHIFASFAALSENDRDQRSVKLIIGARTPRALITITLRSWTAMRKPCALRFSWPPAGMRPSTTKRIGRLPPHEISVMLSPTSPANSFR
jgi:hypothetical protein